LSLRLRVPKLLSVQKIDVSRFALNAVAAIKVVVTDAP
jgi:hypothetical protein